MLPHGGIKELAAALKTSRLAIRRALRYQTDTALARMIRKAAIERGGKEYDPDRRKRTT